MKRPSHTLPNEKFVAYFRVSTRKQGLSGLGLSAQRYTVQQFIQHNGNRIIAQFEEIESGKHDNRAELMKAIQTCKEQDATLVIAKLDRLSRDVAFISALMKSGVKFVACDIPEATNLTVHIFAAMAEFERERISTRIKEAIAAKRKLKGKKFKWGNPQNLTDKSRMKAYETSRRNANENREHSKAYNFIQPLRTQKMSWQKIAVLLNAGGYRTRFGKKFSFGMVKYVFDRFTNIKISKL